MKSDSKVIEKCERNESKASDIVHGKYKILPASVHETPAEPLIEAPVSVDKTPAEPVVEASAPVDEPPVQSVLETPAGSVTESATHPEHKNPPLAEPVPSPPRSPSLVETIGYSTNKQTNWSVIHL
jgi:hypothetical protein